MLPAKRRDVRDNRRRDIGALAIEFNKRLFEVACIPQDDRGNQQIWVPGSSGTENSAKAFSFLNRRYDFLTLAVVPALLARPHVVEEAVELGVLRHYRA